MMDYVQVRVKKEGAEIYQMAWVEKLKSVVEGCKITIEDNGVFWEVLNLYTGKQVPKEDLLKALEY